MIDSLKKTSLFNECGDEFWQKIQKSSFSKAYNKDHLFFSSGDSAKYCYVLLLGWVKLFRENVDGGQCVIDIVNQGCVFGEDAMFNDGKYSICAEAIEDAHVVIIPLDIIREELDVNTKFAFRLMSVMDQNRQAQNQEIENRTIKNASQRLGCFLLQCLKGQGKTDSATIDLPYDKLLVASKLGMQPETFSRALKRLTQDLEIETSGRSIHITSVSKLSEYACSVCSGNASCR